MGLFIRHILLAIVARATINRTWTHHSIVFEFESRSATSLHSARSSYRPPGGALAPGAATRTINKY
jgi:hypothetical protein